MLFEIEQYIDSDGQELTKRTWNDDDIEYENKQCLLHREDGPAVIWADGSVFYHLEGKKVSKREVDLYWIKKQVGK